MSDTPSRSGSRWEPESTTVEATEQQSPPESRTVVESAARRPHRLRGRAGLVGLGLAIAATTGLGGFALGHAADDSDQSGIVGTSGATSPDPGGSHEPPPDETRPPAGILSGAEDDDDHEAPPDVDGADDDDDDEPSASAAP